MPREKVLNDRGEKQSRAGRASFSVLLFQDLAVVAESARACRYNSVCRYGKSRRTIIVQFALYQCLYSRKCLGDNLGYVSVKWGFVCT